MTKAVGTEDEVIELIERLGMTKAAKKLGVTHRNLNYRRRRIEARRGIVIKTPKLGSPTADLTEHPGRLGVEMEDGHILIGSDSHYYPGIISAAHRAFVKFNKELKPKYVIKNGDELDFPKISRHAPIGWENQPSVVAEIETAQDRLEEIRQVNKNAKYYWPLGNHDARFETRLATIASEYANVKGIHLKDHFPGWSPCWSVWVNDEVVIKHRWNNGIHAVYNNTLKSGKTIITGHLHSLKVTPWTDYNGTRFGVDCGSMADPWGPQFENYMEDNSRNWVSGFIVLTFHKGRLLWPEHVHVIDEKSGLVEFRGQVYEV